MIKNGFFTLSMIILPLIGFTQRTFQSRTYYDLEKTKSKEIITMKRKDSTLHGDYASFYLNGSLAVKGYYTEGISDSSWVYYYENGHEKARGFFKEGQQHRRWYYYYESGHKKAEGNYQRSKKHGIWTYYYESGQEKSSGTYLNDLRSGIWNYFYEDGSLRAQAFYKEGKGTYKEFYPSGQLKGEGMNINDKSEGTWTYYHENGAIEATGSFNNGIRTGLWTFHHENGQVAGKGLYDDGVKTGKWTYYFEDGSVSSEGEMNDDQQEGYWKLYYQTGALKGEGKYDKGSGDYVEYYPNGKLKAKGAMENGLREGKWQYFTESGMVDGEAEFVNGTGVYKGYYSDGAVKMTGNIEGSKRTGDWTLYNTDGSIAGIYKPVYEEEKPIFRSTNLKAPEEKKSSSKPEYLFKYKKTRYFNPKINEYTGLIVATNPIWPAIDQIPFSIEYYMQERLGYELNLVMHKAPFYNSVAGSSGPNTSSLGIDAHLRQKFYHNDSKLGMPYFGHEILFGYLQHQTFVNDVSRDLRINAEESRIAYGIVVGNRWVQRTEDSGMTVDFNIGVGIGRRFFTKDFDPQYFFLFDELNQDKLYLPVIFTLNIGFIGPKRRTTS